MSNSIYQIRCRINNKVYIGKTTQSIHGRWERHVAGCGNAPFLYRAIRKYGPENFDVWVLYPDAVTEGHLNMLEEMFIKQFKSNDRRYGYNLATGGQARGCGWRHSLETKRKIGEANKGRKPSENTILGIVKALKGKKLSKSHRKKLSKAGRGNKNSLGCNHSEQTRRKISKTLRLYHQTRRVA